MAEELFVAFNTPLNSADTNAVALTIQPDITDTIEGDINVQLDVDLTDNFDNLFGDAEEIVTKTIENDINVQQDVDLTDNFANLFDDVEEIVKDTLTDAVGGVPQVDFADIGGFVWQEQFTSPGNNNVFDDGQDSLIGGAIVTLIQNGIRGPSVVTGDDGAYRFEDLLPSIYEVEFQVDQVGPGGPVGLNFIDFVEPGGLPPSRGSDAISQDLGGPFLVGRTNPIVLGFNDITTINAGTVLFLA